MKYYVSVDPIDVARRMFWLAYQACGGTFRMGAFQARDNTNENEVWSNVQTRGDYPGCHAPKPGKAYGDYVFGRMMKMAVEWDANEGTVTYPDRSLDPSYQAWSMQYPVYYNLFEAACRELGASWDDKPLVGPEDKEVAVAK